MKVLIETSWNVKKTMTSDVPLLRSINRNIVECKGEHQHTEIVHDVVLIETSWNVKIRPSSELTKQPCINRNIVECKVS